MRGLRDVGILADLKDDFMTIKYNKVMGGRQIQSFILLERGNEEIARIPKFSRLKKFKIHF